MKKNRLYKLVFFNLIVFFALIGFIFLIPPSTYLIYSKINNLLNLSSVNATSHLAKLPNYNNFFWAEDYYKEESRLTSSYHDYLIWRFDDFNGNHINIINGIRKTFFIFIHNS